MPEACKWTTMWGFWYPGCESFGIPGRPIDGATCPYCGEPIEVMDVLRWIRESYDCRHRGCSMDKAETVLAMLRVGPLRDWVTTDERLDEIAAILRREYGDVRREALEEALQAMQQVLVEHSLGLDYAEDGRYTWPERWVALEKKIRAAKEET